jgi:tetratricopeptide (TPR) repeat protein
MQAFSPSSIKSEPRCGSFFHLLTLNGLIGATLVSAALNIDDASAQPIVPSVSARATALVKPSTLGLAANRFIKLTPTSPDQVLERLPPRVGIKNDESKNVALNTNGRQNVSSTNSQASLSTASQLIALARTTGDPRYLGRAQANLGSLWDASRAPIQAMILQATIEQSRHEFDAARRTLQRAIGVAGTQTLRQSGENFEQLRAYTAQAWLTLATLERVAGNYPQALQACNQVLATDTSFYGKACLLETQSLLGEHNNSISGFKSLVARLESASASQAADQLATSRAWLYSLLGEAQERAGNDQQAQKAYDTSLQIQSDIYTAIAAADLALRQTMQITSNANRALRIIEVVAETDSTLIRKALALKRLNNPQWQAIATDLRERFTQLKNRGDDPKAHARERALVELWLTENYPESLRLSLVNLERQREAIDWNIALQAAAKLNDSTTRLTILERLQKTKLMDARLVLNNV